MTADAEIRLAYSQYSLGVLSLQEFLDLLPEDTDPRFQTYLNLLSEEGETTLDRLRLIVANPDEIYRLRAYAAFVALATYYRRSGDHRKLWDLLQRYKASFEDRALFCLFESLYYLDQGGPSSLRSALRCIQDALDKVDSHQGVFAAYADIVATGESNGAFHHPELIDDATEKIEAASRIAPEYAKYYYLKGKLLLLRDEYTPSMQLIMRAIELEDPNRSTYATVVSEYQVLLNRAISLKANHDLTQRILAAETRFHEDHEILRKSADSAKTESISQLVFFTGIIAIIFSSVQSAGNSSLETGIILIVALTGCLLVAFGVFSYYIVDRPLRRALPMFAAGAALTVGAIVAIVLVN